MCRYLKIIGRRPSFLRQRIFKIRRPRRLRSLIRPATQRRKSPTRPYQRPSMEGTHPSSFAALSPPPYTPRKKPTSRYSSRLPKPTSTDDKYSKRASTRDIGITIDRVPDPIHGRRTPCHCQRNPLAKIYATPNASLGTTVRRTQQR